MMMEIVPSILKTNWKAPGRKKDRKRGEVLIKNRCKSSVKLLIQMSWGKVLVLVDNIT